MKIIAELSILPIGVEVSLSKYIVVCEKILEAADLKIQLHAEGTNIEGEYDQVMKAIKQCLETVHSMNVPRIVANIKISSRKDKIESLEAKVISVEEKM